MTAARKRLLLWSAPVVLLVLAFSLKALLGAYVGAQAGEAYRRGDFGTAQEQYAHLGLANVYQRWVAPYDRGDAFYGEREYRSAESQFAVALPLAPADQTCRVRGNLALAGEQVGNTAVRAKDRTGAIAAYTRALRNATDGNCASLAARRAELQRILELLRKNQPRSRSSAKPSSHGNTSAPSAADRLQQRNQQAARAQSNSDQANTSPAQAGTVARPW